MMVKHNKKQRGKGGVGVAAAASAEAPPSQSSMVATTAVIAAPAPSSTVAFKNKEKVLVLSTRGITFRYRHLMTDLIALIPHSKKDSKLDTKTDRNVINEVADMKSCTSVVFFEVRKRMDLYLWFAKTPEGPSVKFHVANIHTMAEMKLSGNHLRGSRPVLSFHKAFEEQPHLQLIKELLTQVFATPKRHHKSKPFFDHVLAFSVADGRVWFRNYQVVVPVDKSKVDPESATLVEVGPRFCLNPIRIFDGAFGGRTLYENPMYVSPNAVRAAAKKAASGKYVSKVKAQQARKQHLGAHPMPRSDMEDLFMADRNEDAVPHPRPAVVMALAMKSAVSAPVAKASRRSTVMVRAGKYDEELMKTAKTIATPGRGILAMDESNATCGKRLDSIGVENTEDNRRAYRELLLSAPGLGNYISGAILFEETLYQDTKSGKSMVAVLGEQGIVPGIKVDKGLVTLAGSNNEQWCMGLDGLDKRSADYYKQGARFAKWRSVVSIPQGPSTIAVRDCAYGLARYAAISQAAGLVPIVEPEVLLDGDHDIDRTLEVAEAVWAETFKYMADNKVLFEGILLKPAMVTPGADCPNRASPTKVAEYTLKLLKRRVPPAVPGIMFLSGGQSELEATLNLNEMNKSPNPWHVSFSYARALQNSVLKTWQGKPENVAAAQEALLKRATANSEAQLGKYDPASEGTTEAAKSLYEKGYKY